MFKAMLTKEFILVLRDRYALAALFIMPSLFILIMSMALKDTMNSERILLRYAVIDQDSSLQSSKLQGMLRENQSIEEVRLSLDNTREKQKALHEKVQFILSIPTGFSETIFNGQADPPLLQLDAAEDVKQEMLTVFQAGLAAAVMRLRIDRLLEEAAPFLPDGAQQLSYPDYPANEMISVRFSGTTAGKRPSSTQQSVPSWIIFGMFFVIIPMSTIFINERSQNTLMRMSTMNISTPTLLAGKIAPYLVINQIQVWLMIGVGVFLVPLFGGDSLTMGNSVVALVMVSLGLSLAATGTSVLIAVLAKTVEQATTIGGIINILLGAIGGIMVPKSYMPETMQNLADFSPMSWGLEGFLDVFLRGLGAKEVITESLALSAFGLVLMVSSGLLFNHAVRTGA